MYLSLEIEPHRVDVNVHPTKREVGFLHEEEIVRRMCESIQETLAAVDASRSYTLTQTALPAARVIPGGSTSQQAPSGASRGASGGAGENSQKSSSKTKRPYDYNLVRSDARDRKITTMLQPKSLDPGSGDGEYEYDDSRSWTPIKFTSIRKLRAAVRESAHKDLCDVVHNHTFVGLVDDQRRLAAVQHGVKLYLIDYAAASFELFYQIGLSDFANFGVIRLNPPLAIREILDIAIKAEKSRGDTDKLEPNGEAHDWDATAKVGSIHRSCGFSC